MVFSVNGVYFFVALSCVAIEAAKLPSDWKLCSRSAPDFNDCTKASVEDAIRKLKNGAPELGLRTFDPLDIPELIIGEGRGPVHVTQHYKNVKLYGLTGSKVLATGVDFDNRIMTARSNTPELRLQGEYTMKGRIMLLPIIGSGPCNVTLINTKINHTIYGEPVEKRGKIHWTFKDYVVTLRPERVIYKFDNLFDGDKRLGDDINKVLNDNWNEVFTDVREGYEKSFGTIFHGLASRVFSKVALDDIFLQ